MCRRPAPPPPRPDALRLRVGDRPRSQCGAHEAAQGTAGRRGGERQRGQTLPAPSGRSRRAATPCARGPCPPSRRPSPGRKWRAAPRPGISSSSGATSRHVWSGTGTSWSRSSSRGGQGPSRERSPGGRRRRRAAAARRRHAAPGRRRDPRTGGAVPGAPVLPQAGRLPRTGLRPRRREGRPAVPLPPGPRAGDRPGRRASCAPTGTGGSASPTCSGRTPTGYGPGCPSRTSPSTCSPAPGATCARGWFRDLRDAGVAKVVAKRLDSPYRAGSTWAWHKIRHADTSDALLRTRTHRSREAGPGCPGAVARGRGAGGRPGGAPRGGPGARAGELGGPAAPGRAAPGRGAARDGDVRPGPVRGVGGGVAGVVRRDSPRPSSSALPRSASGTVPRPSPGTVPRSSPGTVPRSSPGTVPRSSPGTGVSSVPTPTATALLRTVHGAKRPQQALRARQVSPVRLCCPSCGAHLLPGTALTGKAAWQC
ncbi:hypothetical protein GGE06_003967 [Streptomyces sp. SFB5A]|uniref:Uncharacterized protein n=1 Tax=Streptomyces nymphaeiformis TaxID=2663842 RepID=A0A7W7U118_9ACTN|nr:hypothetical protein [Streptomyces nymphaeiformis]